MSQILIFKTLLLSHFSTWLAEETDICNTTAAKMGDDNEAAFMLEGSWSPQLSHDWRWWKYVSIYELAYISPNNDIPLFSTSFHINEVL